MNRRRTARIAFHPVEERGAASGDYRAGYQAGYALGYQLGREDSGTVFEGPSIIIPARPHDDAVIRIIQQIEAATPHPYEVLIADAGASVASRRYFHDRSGALRHIKGSQGENLVQVVNRAMKVSLGEYIAVLTDSAPVCDNWIGEMLFELEHHPEAKVVCAASRALSPPFDQAQEQSAFLEEQTVRDRIGCVLFRRKLPAEIGWWDEGTMTVEEHLQKWLDRLEKTQRIFRSDIFNENKTAAT
ncbi:glycosyltransferase family A protein [Paenibacillus lactis]|uniref:Glycosyltransferase 2-like domain-containing protein n=1 Tax=Paenibacillus lactis TaxID=228574 RepID=A0ABS4FEP3_9BACL|nr:glycosyltransferase family A protein [Paenibacillus lactis]MBP1894724.1 hypothetical protein [Paenibacillus lactis]GIO92843.1 hypothetical protein J31TS3_40700 [Paenibacillus lactis]HAG00191.1 hypothetical protein [Paenibacillus lactis]